MVLLGMLVLGAMWFLVPWGTACVAFAGAVLFALSAYLDGYASGEKSAQEAGEGVGARE